MKKKLILGLLVASAPFMLAGCGDKDEESSSKKASANTKNITCTSNEDDMEATVDLEYNTKKEEFTGGSITVKMDLSDYDEDEIEEIEGEADQFCEIIEDSLEFAENCQTKVTSKEFKASFDIDLDTINDEYEGEDLDDIVEDIESELEVECKVK